MQHDMPQSLLVFAVSFTPETSNFGTFGGIAHPFEEIFAFFIVYMHIFEIQIVKVS